MEHIHLEKFASIEEAIGKTRQTPFVAIIQGMGKCLIVSKHKYGDTATIVRNDENNFIKVGNIGLFTLDIDQLDNIYRVLG